MSRMSEVIKKALPDKLFLNIQYYKTFHKWLNIDRPVTYQEKLAYLKTHNIDPALTNLCDKYEVRKYISDAVGDKYLVPLVGVYDSEKEIPWDDLPDKYVLKCTHDSQSIILHTSEVGFDRTAAMRSLSDHMKKNLFWYSREYPYKNIRPRIVCEEFLDDNGKSPDDYKFLCFNGEPRYIVLDMDRHTNHHRDLYDVNWIKQDFITDHEQGETAAPRPETLDEMLSVARRLSKGFAHVRVDLYSVKKRVYFGELTFFPWGGLIWFKPDEWNYRLGKMIKI